MSKHDNCNNRSYKSTTINYTYSLFLKDSVSNIDDTLSSTTTYSSKTKFNNAKNKAANYANYSVCVAYSGTVYTCPGHRDAVTVGNRTLTYAANYNKGDVLSCMLPDKIRQNLVLELNLRKLHALYKSLKLYVYGPYKRGDIVHHDLPTSMSQHIGTLNAFISSVTNVAPKLHNGKGDYKHSGSTYGFSSPAYRSNSSISLPMSVISGDNTFPNDLKPMLPNISVDYNDCICYSDCILHGSLKVKYCSCNINCMCNY